MAAEVAADLNDSYEADSSDEMDRPTERWAPLGAASSLSSLVADNSHISELERLQLLEEEQDQLNSSLLALTTHFAQVQFRLKQIVEAETNDKETLLKELEEFASKGIPDISSAQVISRGRSDSINEDECSARITVQREKQLELIVQLKSQLEDLETFAYETGSSELPTSRVMEKQNAIIDQLKHNLDLNLDNFDRLSTEELRVVVDHAIRQIVNPVKVKEKLVEQLKTQVTDLERFISFLQGEAQSPGPLGSRCTCPVHGPAGGGEGHSADASRAGSNAPADAKKGREQLTALRQTLAMLQVVLVSQLGCGSRDFKRNVLKKSAKGNHWGDLRAELEIQIDKVTELAQKETSVHGEESDYASDTDDAPIIQCNRELVTAVRKGLALALCRLLQHGLVEVGQNSSVARIGCFPSRSAQTVKMMHAWQLFLKYYEMKQGEEFTELPARKLSQSFSLDIVGGKAITAKQTLLSAIEEILTSHKPLKRSDDCMFKAFVCLGLNQKRLVSWLRIILRTSQMIEYYYQPWSYVVSTGFNDALASLDRLSKINFHLPTDLAIRPFHNIKDAF